MSLVQHVSAVEGLDRLPLLKDDDAESLLSGYLASSGLLPSRSRRESFNLSYDPVPAAGFEQKERVEVIPAYEVSVAKRVTQVTIGVFSCVIGAGLVFGFAALKPVLVSEGVYRELCTEQELRDEVETCYKQDLKLNFTFNIASVTTNVSALLVGSILDRYGPRVCGLSGSVFLLLGSLCMAFEHILPFDGVIGGSFLLALAGTFVFLPTFHLSNAFPRYQGLILALVTGAFDASAAVFLIFRIIYEASAQRFGVHQFFLAFLVVPVFIFAAQLFIMPTKSYETRLELQQVAEEAQDPKLDVHDSDDELPDNEVWKARSLRADERTRIRAEIRSLLGNAAEQQEHEKQEEHRKEKSQAWGALHGLPAFFQMRSPWFILITIFTILQMARFNLFIATIHSQYRYMLESRRAADTINNVFDLALPIGGVAAVPFIGTLLDNLSVAAVLGVVMTISTATGVLGVLPYMWAGYANVILFCLFRPLYYSAMSDYAVKVFGLTTFGTIYGTMICISGLLTFTQSALQALTHDVFHGNPTPINLVLTVLLLLSGALLVGYVAVASRTVQQEIIDEEERRSLLQQDTPRLGPYASPHLLPQFQSPHLTPHYGSTVRSARGLLERPSLANLRQLSTVQESSSKDNDDFRLA